MKTKLMKPLIVSSGIVITVMSGWWLMRENKKLEIAATNYWGRLEPAFQSTSAGDTLLGNVFEPLVDLSTSGGIAPGLAERWEVNEESTLFRFHLREGVKYSDGSEFEAKDFIRSWINAVQKTELDSEKPNTLDVLYKVKGFSAQTLKSGIIPGLRVIDSNILEIEFEHPFRTALFELTGTRYATWKETHENGVIGTGPYQITEHLPGELVRYAPNPFSEKKARYNEVIVRGFEDAWSEMKSGKWGALIGELLSDEADSKFDYIGKGISAHQIMDVNGGSESIFSDPQLRKALQYAVHKILAKTSSSHFPRVSFDPQIFAPLWEGRLSDSEAERIISTGKEHLSRLIETTKSRPIKFVYSSGFGKEIEEELKSLGLQFQDIGAPVSKKTLIDTVYSKSDFDITYGGASVVGNDPDGIYHLLGKNGAITSKAIFRIETSRLLEEGRLLKKSNDLNSHYQKVSRAVLNEVPIIHIRFVPPFGFINKNILGYESSKVNSDRFWFDNLRKN